MIDTQFAFFVAIFGGFAFFTDAAGGVDFAVLVVIGVIAAILGLAYLLFIFFIQFYGQAIVLDDLGAIDGIKHSVSIVRQNLLSTLGHSVLAGVLGGIAGLVFGGATILISPQSTNLVSLSQVSLAGAVGVTVLIIVLGSLFGGFFGVYSVAFYRTINPKKADS